MDEEEGENACDALSTGLDELRASNRKLGDMPLVILSARGKGREDFLPPNVKPEEVAELVVLSVKQVVDAARTRGRVDTKALEPFVHEGPLPSSK